MSSSRRPRPASEAIIAGGVVVVLVALVAAVFLSGAGDTLYPPKAATTQARDTRGLYDIVFAISVGIFLIVEALIVWSILRYRRRPEDTELPAQTHGNNLVEVIWTLIPTAIVLFLFVVSWRTLNTVDAVSSSPDIRIHAVAGQFQWQFEYLDRNGTKVATQTIPAYDATSSPDGGMAVPVGKSVQVTLSSPDVIHAFYVPRFLFKRDVIPGQTNRFEFTVDPSEAGQVFRGQCAELCGDGHRRMLFNVIALDQASYDTWLQNLIARANATPAPVPSGTSLQLTAKGITYLTTSLETAANAPFSIVFKNEDPAGTVHDVEIRAADGTVIKKQPTTDGGQTSTYVYEALPAGTYTFICSIHPIPQMTGTLTVK